MVETHLLQMMFNSIFYGIMFTMALIHGMWALTAFADQALLWQWTVRHCIRMILFCAFMAIAFAASEQMSKRARRK